MNSDQLRQFRAIAANGSISKAAEALYLSQPALSISLSKLEKELDCKLFVRRGRTMELTEEGSKLVKYAITVTNAIDEALQEVGAASRNRPLEFYRIGGTATSLLLSGLYSIPDLQLVQELVFNRELPHYLGRENALFVADERYVPARAADELERIRLYTKRLLLSVHRDDPLAQEAAVDVRELERCQLVGRSGAKGFNDWVDDVAADNRCSIRMAYTTDYIMFAAEGHNIANPFLMNSFGESVAMSQHSFANRRSIPIVGRYTERDIYLWYPKRVAERATPLIDLILRNAEVVTNADEEMRAADESTGIVGWYL